MGVLETTLTEEQRRWALAFGLLDLDAGDVERGQLPADADACRSRLRGYNIDSRDDVLAYFKAKREGDAYEISRLIAVAAHAVAPGFIDELTAWHVIWAAADLAKRTYKSWREFAETYDMIFTQITDGRATATQEVARLLADPTSPWATLPWDLMGANIKARVLRVTCERCGAPRTRPSPTAFVYCDHCGALIDYDVSVAVGAIAPPGPVYEQLRRELAPAIEAARARGDRDAYRALQRKLFDAWVELTPSGVPIRTRDPEYRARYVAYLAEATTVGAFDDRAHALEAAMHEATAGLAFAVVDGKPRVAPEPYRALVDRVFAYEARRDELFDPTVYGMHPDGASRAVQRRIGHSMFVQGWLPYLAEADAKELLERTDLARDYDELPPPALRAYACNRCGATLEIVDGAKRVVCEHCGRLVDIVA